MTNVAKILKKMRDNPLNWKIEQLETVVKPYGVRIRKSGGSHVIFEHSRWIQLLSIPAHRPIKPIYVKKLIALIDSLENNDEK